MGSGVRLHAGARAAAGDTSSPEPAAVTDPLALGAASTRKWSTPATIFFVKRFFFFLPLSRPPSGSDLAAKPPTKRSAPRPRPRARPTHRLLRQARGSECAAPPPRAAGAGAGAGAGHG